MNSLSYDFKALKQKAKELQSYFIQSHKSLVVAESLTGGLVSHLLTLNPGASQFFLGGVVCYSLSAKTQQLGIPQKLLKEQGAVNESVCRLMAQGVKKKWGGDYALSLTGLAGPGKKKQDPVVGTIFIGFLGPGGCKVQKWELDREEGLETRVCIQQKSALLALDFGKMCIDKGL